MTPFVEVPSSLTNASAGGQLEHPCEVNSSSTTGPPSPAPSVCENAGDQRKNPNPTAIIVAAVISQRARRNRSRRIFVFITHFFSRPFLKSYAAEELTAFHA